MLIIKFLNEKYDNLKETFSARKFISLLENLTNNKNEEIALDSCICLGKLGVKNSYFSINKLNRIIHGNSNDWRMKTLAVQTLVKLFDVKDSKTIFYILNQAQNSPDWISKF